MKVKETSDKKSLASFTAFPFTISTTNPFSRKVFAEVQPR